MGELKLNGPLAAVLIVLILIGGCTISHIFGPKTTPEQIKTLDSESVQ